MWTFLGGMFTGSAVTLAVIAVGAYWMMSKVKPELEKMAKVPAPVPGQVTTYQLDLKTLEGESLSLERFKDKAVFLNFWGTKCGPCVAEMPSIQKLYEQVKDEKDVVVLAVSVYDSPEELKDFSDKHGYTMPIYLLAESLANQEIRIDGAFKMRGIPSTFIIAPDGTIELHKLGSADWGSQKVVDYLKKLALKI